MLFIDPDNQYARYIGDLQKQHPSWNVGDDLPSGWLPVQEVGHPTYQENEVLYEDFPVLIDGVYVQNWKIRPMTPEELDRKAQIQLEQEAI